MADIRPILGTFSSLTVTGLSTLASATYVASSSINTTTNDPEDVIVEVSVATTNTPAGNKQVVVFAQASNDNSSWTSGPISGTTTTDEPDLYVVGVVPINTATTTHRRQFPLAAAFGFIPNYVRLVFKNDLGVALTSATVTYAELQRSIV